MNTVPSVQNTLPPTQQPIIDVEQQNHSPRTTQSLCGRSCKIAMISGLIVGTCASTALTIGIITRYIFCPDPIREICSEPVSAATKQICATKLCQLSEWSVLIPSWTISGALVGGITVACLAYKASHPTSQQ